jgi:hypothetical protein
MAEFTGSSLYVQWNAGTNGTIDLSGDYRSVSFKPSIGQVETTAGSDPYKSYITTQKDTTVDYSGVFQTAGTATENALLAGQVGTLTIGPEGTAATKRKYTLPGAISQGANFNFAYADVVEISCSFQGSGTLTYGTF